MKRFFRMLYTLCFPPRCAACGILLDWYRAYRTRDALCPACLEKWEREKLERCGICAKPVCECECLPSVLHGARAKSFRKLVYYAPGREELTQNRVVYYMKRNRNADLYAFLAAQLHPALDAIVAKVNARWNIVLTYVPRAKSSVLAYGTDQARSLAKALADVSGLPCKALIKRIPGSNKEQKRLSKRARYRNAERSYRIPDALDLSETAVILLDDVTTTGASMAACTKLLRHAGARSVFCLSVASDEVNRDREF